MDTSYLYGTYEDYVKAGKEMMSKGGGAWLKNHVPRKWVEVVDPLVQLYRLQNEANKPYVRPLKGRKLKRLPIGEEKRAKTRRINKMKKDLASIKRVNKMKKDLANIKALQNINKRFVNKKYSGVTKRSGKRESRRKFAKTFTIM